MPEKHTLSGVRVLEFTHAVMGPAAGLVLADLGAEVIRIEPAPHGDHTRYLKGFGTGFYTFYNRNKKSLALNLKTEVGLEISHKLIGTADVLIENFGPGTAERLGLGFSDAQRLNPRLIYCRLKGFLDGPYSERAALDEVVQMMSGLAYMTGLPGRPLRVGASIVDVMGGTYGALGIILALRDRDHTGEGALVDNGLFETAAFLMGQHMAYAAISQEPVPPMTARVSPWSIYRQFKTADDQLVFIGITSDQQWGRFCQAFSRQDLLENNALATNDDRIQARDWLMPDLEIMFQVLPLIEILTRCEEAKIPFAPIAHPEDLFEDPQLLEGNSLVRVALPDGREALLPRLPLTLDGNRPDLTRDPPRLGEHTGELLRELNFSDDEIKNLHNSEIIVAADQENQL